MSKLAVCDTHQPSLAVRDDARHGFGFELWRCAGAAATTCPGCWGALFGIDKQRFDRDITHSGVLSHPTNQATERRFVAGECVGKKLSIRQNQRSFTDFV